MKKISTISLKCLLTYNEQKIISRKKIQLLVERILHSYDKNYFFYYIESFNFNYKNQANKKNITQYELNSLAICYLYIIKSNILYKKL